VGGELPYLRAGYAQVLSAASVVFWYVEKFANVCMLVRSIVKGINGKKEIRKSRIFSGKDGESFLDQTKARESLFSIYSGVYGVIRR